MSVCFEKKSEKKIEEISKILLTILKCFKKNLEILDNFNKKYSIMHAFFFKEKHCTLIVYITEFFLKSGGAKCINAPPPSKIWGPWPPGPPCGGPHDLLKFISFI